MFKVLLEEGEVGRGEEKKNRSDRDFRGPTKPKILIIWFFTEKVCQSLSMPSNQNIEQHITIDKQVH